MYTPFLRVWLSNPTPKTKIDLCLPGGKVVHVNDKIHVVDANGKVVHVANNNGAKARGIDAKSGWVAYAGWTNTGGSPISSFTTTWSVPATPATDNGQTVFLFNSIEPASFNAILQPVLQYGPSAAGGGSYWTVASWYVAGSQAYYSPLVSVSVGDVLDGVITLTGTNGGYSYASSFSNVGGTTLTVNGVDELVWATETLESYHITSSSDYPTGSTTFYNINLGTADGNTPSVTWSPVSDSGDGLYTTVNIDGATNAQISIAYPS